MPATKTLRFYVGDKPVSDVHNRLSGIARASAMKGGERLPAKALRKVLVDSGIADPDTTAWKFSLPNGVVIGARFERAAQPADA